MRLLQGSAFFGIFASLKDSAFHLEVEDAYHTPEESVPFKKFLNSEPDDLKWHHPWLDLVRDISSTGKTIQRVRIVSVPHVDYTRWGLSVAPHNIEAGEEISWLPRHLLGDADVTADDFWLIDRNRVVFTVFAPDGKFSGGAETSDSFIVERCCRIRDHLWDLAIPHSEYAH